MTTPLTLTHVEILRWLDAHPMSSAREVAMGIDSKYRNVISTATRIRTLINAGFAKPVYETSMKRVYHVTAAGRAFLEAQTK